MDPALSFTICLFTAGLFAAAVGHKLSDFGRFAATVAAYRIVPQSLAAPAAAAAIAAELVTAGLILSFAQEWQAIGMLMAVGLLVGYAGAIGVNLLRGNVRIDCGCLGFTARTPRLTRDLVVRNLVLAGLAALALLPRSSRTLGWLDIATIAGGLAMAGLLYIGFAAVQALPREESFG